MPQNNYTTTKEAIKEMFKMSNCRDELVKSLKSYFSNLPKITPAIVESHQPSIVDFAQKLFYPVDIPGAGVGIGQESALDPGL